MPAPFFDPVAVLESRALPDAGHRLARRAGRSRVRDRLPRQWSLNGSFERAEALFATTGLAATMLRNGENAGILANYDRLVAASSSELLAALSTWYEPGHVAAMKALAAGDPDAGWYSYGGWRFLEAEQASVAIDERDYVTDRLADEVNPDGGEPHIFIGCVYRREALLAVGGWDGELPIEDRELFLRLGKRFAHGRTAQRLVHYRRTSMTASANAAFMLDGWEKYYAKHADAFGSQLSTHWAECLRTNAALLIDQGQFRAQPGPDQSAGPEKPFKQLNWRTFAYLCRNSLARVVTRLSEV